MDGNWWVEIVFLAMLAGFIALRLVSVLGRRTGHERPAGDLYRPGNAEIARPGGALMEAPARAQVDLPSDTPEALRDGLGAIARADGAFEPKSFVTGAGGAYRMILEAFWRGDISPVESFVADDVVEQFRHAIAVRQEQGLSVDNRLVSIDRARIVAAQLEGTMAEVAVAFEASIVAVTRDADGKVVEGSTSDAVVTRDTWTFRRHVTNPDPNWLLVATSDDN